MTIPVISENMLISLQNQLESGFDLSVEGKVKEQVQKGIFAMELSLGIDSNDSYYSEIIRYWRENKGLVSQLKTIEKIIQWFFVILAFAIIPIGLYYAYLTINNGQPIWSGLLIGVLTFVFTFILILLPTKILAKKYKKTGNMAVSKLEPWDVFEYSNGKIGCILNIDTSLAKICEKLGIDPTEAKIGLGRAKGGGSTYVGWGSGRAIGTGIGLSALSSIGAAAKNSAINGRIKELESYIYYNNVAFYFNDNTISQ